MGSIRRDNCFTFGSLFVGATGGAALGYYTKVFKPGKPFDGVKLPGVLKKGEKLMKRLPTLKVGGNFYWQVGAQVVGAMLMYSYLECKFKGGWSRRSLFDCMFAGAITGGGFGLRGVPGGTPGAKLGALGFAGYSGLFYLLFRR